ncbi:hypothetical protein SAMN05421858_1234 [Haladaptatus litoreus]|uniref:DUF7552 domain-containing protein n=1 Tax=Haladaptatus litoreus TaxID=553468 RepID=A0A1N6XQN2_9EURY|nr:hypothetical protein [Haladaptatus litoreus]SIR04648.1 hypothetical protein SAMN05421858_1234 [Haladaptatus litoreus]
MDDILRQTRREIESLAVESGHGRFSVLCAETGECPMPITGKQFKDHDDASRAVELAREYRDALREHDPEIPQYRFVVTEEPARPLQMAGVREQTSGTRANGLPQTQRSVTVASDGNGEWLTMDNAPLVHLARDCGPVGDDAVGRQLDSKL